jgi:hypothetical protein
VTQQHHSIVSALLHHAAAAAPRPTTAGRRPHSSDAFYYTAQLCTGCCVLCGRITPAIAAAVVREPTCGVNRAAAYVALLVEPVVRVVVLTG